MEPEEVLVGARSCPGLRSLEVTSRLLSFVMARLLAGHMDRAGRGHASRGFTMDSSSMGIT
jgi:hypothetical protein